MGAVLKWIFIDTIYGVAAISSLTYAIFWAIKQVAPKAPSPIIVASAIGFLGLLIVPSLPRYLFQRDLLSQLEEQPWIRLTQQTRWGDLTEPLTWIWTPISAATLVMPNEPTIGGFTRVTARYGEKPIVEMADPDCDDFTIEYAAPDREGFFRIGESKPITDQERQTYCFDDWTAEREALRTEILNRKQ